MRVQIKILPLTILILGAFGCNKGPNIPVIASNSEFKEILDQVQKLSQPVFVKSDAGEVLNEADTKALKESIRLFSGLSAYRPEVPMLYLAIGKAHQLLGENKTALENFAVAAKQLGPGTDQTSKLTLAEVQYLSAISFERQKLYEEAKIVAEQAVKTVPESSNYVTALAAAEMQLKQVKECKAHLKKALTLDPTNKRAQYLNRLVQMAEGG